jgi:hypothetical protein
MASHFLFDARNIQRRKFSAVGLFNPNTECFSIGKAARLTFKDGGQMTKGFRKPASQIVNRNDPGMASKA